GSPGGATPPIRSMCDAAPRASGSRAVALVADPLVCGDERVVEVRRRQPTEVDGVVEDDLLELVIGQVAACQRRVEVHVELARRSHGGRAADADDAPRLPGEV